MLAHCLIKLRPCSAHAQTIQSMRVDQCVCTARGVEFPIFSKLKTSCQDRHLTSMVRSLFRRRKGCHHLHGQNTNSGSKVWERENLNQFSCSSHTKLASQSTGLLSLGGPPKLCPLLALILHILRPIIQGGHELAKLRGEEPILIKIMLQGDWTTVPPLKTKTTEVLGHALSI